jgi:ABC-type branched-subunit amino acid transport system ATPase component/branched-subunit amino acid ABC-type transport system permease component
VGLGVQQAIFDGIVSGLTYAVLAAGFVLIYRSTGVLNFALGQMGAFAVALFALFAAGYHIPYWLAFASAVALGALVGAIIELTVVRRLFRSPRLVLLIATIGVAQLLEVARLSLPDKAAGSDFPFPFHIHWQLTSSIVISSRELLVFIVAPAAIGALSLFMTKTRFGLMVRASASNVDTARLYGISAKTTSTIVWTIAGAFAALTAIVAAPLQGVTPGSILRAGGATDIGATLLVPALIVALIARMRSLSMTLVAGVGLGVAESLIENQVAPSNQSIIDLYVFIAAVLLVLFWVRADNRDTSWSISARVPPIPERLRSLWYLRHLNAIGFVFLFGLLAVVPLVLSRASQVFVWTDVLIFALMALPLSMLTGWAGQFSLGQFAFVGLGACTLVTVTHGFDIPVPFALWHMSLHLPWAAAAVVATLVGVAGALIVGVPALRVRGMFLAVVTFVFAVAASNWLFSQAVFTGSKYNSETPFIRPPKLGELDFSYGRTFYYLCLVLLIVAAALMARIRRTGLGRSMIASCENERAATAATISAARMKLVAFTIAGAMAALAGCLFITLRVQLTPGATFTPEGSLRLVAVAIVGGLGSIAGPILGALFVRGIPAAFGDSDKLQLLTSSIGLLFLLMYFPGGLIQIFGGLRNVLVRRAERRVVEPVGASKPATTPSVGVLKSAVRTPIPEPPAGPWLKLDTVSVHFGGIRAVDAVTLEVNKGELVGLIGANGAGKSTLMNAVSGFVHATGQIYLLGRDISRLAPHRRHEAGLGRGFQDARLYSDLTVLETLMVALEARERSRVIPSIVGLPPSPASERRKRASARDLIDLLGLGRYADHFICDLSTGTRRVVELGCLVAGNARVVMLDEPTGGLAQRETEAFGPLIVRIRRELGAAMVVIEHDMPLIMEISDRVYCLEAGRVIAEGSPEAIRRDRAVIASYLGTDDGTTSRPHTDAPAR